MSSARQHIRRVLAIVPHSKGIGFAVFESVRKPIDWGIKRVSGNKNVACLKKVDTLIENYQPDVIVVETTDDSRRCDRIKKLIAQITYRAQELGVEVANFSRREVMIIFSDKPIIKHDTAQLIAKRFPALRPRLPGPRKPWQSEDYRISIFEAIGLCLVWIGAADKDWLIAA